MKVYIKKGGIGGPVVKADGSRQYRRTYLIRSQFTLYESQVRVAPGIPSLGSPHPGDPDAFCDSQEFNATEHPGIWTCDVGWSTVSGGDPDKDKPPLDRAPVVKWSFVDEPEFPLVDLDKKPFLTSAGIRFPSIQPIMRSYLTLQITQNVGQVSPRRLQEYHNAVNSDRFLEFAKHTCKLRITAGEIRWEKGQWFNEITWELLYKEQGWHPTKWLDAATHQLARQADGSVGLVPILDQWGQPVGEPWPLDGEGKALPLAQVVAGNVTFIEFRTHHLRKFTGVVPPSTRKR